MIGKLTIKVEADDIPDLCTTVVLEGPVNTSEECLRLRDMGVWMLKAATKTEGLE